MKKSNVQKRVYVKKPKNKAKIWFLIFIIIVVVSSFSTIFWKDVSPYYAKAFNKFDSTMRENGVTGKIYFFFKDNIANLTPIGIFIIFYITTLFFCPPMPSEAIFITYLSLNVNPFLLISIAVSACFFGQVTNYGIGFFFNKKFSKKKENLKWTDMINKYGGVLLFIANIFPLPAELLSMLFGVSKFKFRNFMIITIISRLLKFSAMVLLFIYAKPFITGII